MKCGLIPDTNHCRHVPWEELWYETGTCPPHSQARGFRMGKHKEMSHFWTLFTRDRLCSEAWLLFIQHILGAELPRWK